MKTQRPLPRNRFQSALLAAALAVAALLCSAAGNAIAATVDVTVVNDRGIAQAGVYVQTPSATRRTDGAGQITLSGVTPGQTLHFSRCLILGAPGGSCRAPESPTGVAWEVPDPVPAAKEIVLPSLSDPNYTPYQPALSDPERGVLGLINDERAARGLEPLVHSTTLTDPADRYGNYLVTTDQFDHLAFFSPPLRGVDAGWPKADSVTENLSKRGNPTEVFAGWMDSDGHRANLLNASFDSAGLSRVGDVWVLKLAQCPSSLAERCQLTGDIGDSSLASGGSGDGGPASSGLRLRSAKQKRSKVKLTYAVKRGAEPLRFVELSRGGLERRLRLRPRAGGYVAKGKLSKGTWKARVELAGNERYREKTVCTGLRVKRLRGDDRRGWVKIARRPC